MGRIALIILGLICLLHHGITGSVEFKPFEMDSTPQELVWCGNAREVILVMTENSSLYRSEDKGFSWKKLNDILQSKGKDELDPDENEIGKISEILMSPVDKNLVIFLGTHGINWVSEDCGKKISALNHGRKIQEFIFHPTERNWVLASAYTICTDFKEGPCLKYKEIFVTKDLGETWTLLLPYVVQFGWGIVGENHIKLGIPKERILISHDPRGKGNQNHAGWSYKIDLIYTDDFLKTRKTAVHKGNKFLLTNDYLFVAQVVDQELQEVNLLVSQIKSKSYKFDSISLESGKFMEHSYTFLDTSEGSVFLHINHFGEQSKYGHVYISDSKGSSFSLSLPHNIRGYDNQCDFERLQGLEGIYIANVVDSDYVKDTEEEIQREAIDNEERMDKKSKKKEKDSTDPTKDFMKTLITYNKGGNWERIKAPERNIEGKLYDCGDNCYLNIHGLSGDYPMFYTVDSAIGIIIGNGNVGEYLSHEPDDISTFLSRDGGLTWFEVRKGSHTYEIGDHGGLLVIANDQHPTDKVLYSWDEGMQWQELRVSNEKIMIRNIIIEPSSTALHFVLYGETQNKKGKKKGITIALNFETLSEKRCLNPEEPDSPNSDYEKWSPSDNNQSHNCLLGRKTIYIRRKREVECFNGQEFERKNTVENCQCTDKDYECDEGFYRPNLNESCTPNDTDNKKLPLEGEVHQAPENCKDYFTISKGYRKVPGNSCINGLKYDPIVIPCPYSGLFSVLGVIFFILILVILFGLLFLSFNKAFIQGIVDYFSSSSPTNSGSYTSNISKRGGKADAYIDISVSPINKILKG